MKTTNSENALRAALNRPSADEPLGNWSVYRIEYGGRRVLLESDLPREVAVQKVADYSSDDDPVVAEETIHVYTLWYAHETDGNDIKLLGVYSTRNKAESALERAMTLPGFRDHPDGLEIACNVIDRDEWTEGFVTVYHGE